MAMLCGTCMATSQPRFICVFIFSLDGHIIFVFFFLLIRRLRSVGHVWRQVNHVLFVFLSFH